MKRLMMAGTVLVVVIAVVSCTKRDYTCTCTYKEKYGSGTVTDVTTVKGSAREARNACNAHGTNLKAYVNSDVPCYIK